MELLTLTVAQLQTAAFKTLGFQGDMEVSLVRNDTSDTEIEMDVYHVRNVIDSDGNYEVWALNSDRQAVTCLAQERAPNLGRRSAGAPYPR